MLLGYIRPDTRHTESRQRTVLENFGVLAGKIWVEKRRERGDGYPVRKALVGAIRRGHDDCVVVSEFHRLASDGEALQVAVREIRKAKAVIVEAATGRRSDCQADLADMILDTTRFFAQRQLSPREAARMGKAGAEASPVTKLKPGRMPFHLAEVILNDHATYKTVEDALAAINRDRKYKVKWTRQFVYQSARKNRIHLTPRVSGRK